MVTKKINEIMKEIGYLKKDMKVDMGAKGHYNAVSERKVLQMIRPLLVEKGIVIIPVEVQQLERMGSITMAVVRFKVIDIEDGDEEIMTSFGQGFSTGDKGAGSSFTYSLKYLLLKMFILESGDDPDKVADVVHDKERETHNALADKLKQEVGLLSQGNKVAPDMATGMIAYISKHSHDPGVLKEVEKQINELKTR